MSAHSCPAQAQLPMWAAALKGRLPSWKLQAFNLGIAVFMPWGWGACGLSLASRLTSAWEAAASQRRIPGAASAPGGTSSATRRSRERLGAAGWLAMAAWHSMGLGGSRWDTGQQQWPWVLGGPSRQVAATTVGGDSAECKGEDVVGRLRVPQYLLLARTLLLPPFASAVASDGEASGAAAGQLLAPGSGGGPIRHNGQLQRPLPWLWWAARALAVQQRVLSGPAASASSQIGLFPGA
ncbi:hypothetical protein COCSUDRAFT_58315 [Coccomyxa subellipsoidea C-169]|uniref:Uncharacterized protein n=1 Tax=Coccomyxa subellipsoidea (strain C-169) TaxID=574566 RepID=I0YME8_COCSC|nr:hypothetical protein COCSUDRAFT_58315 [Coccomyxa subellipsoidea C-169]EIE19567.1 hypothetical protein COCSUDRAFT_58315 [Coccomyxa subellipsoidea C-169]|eukprot:XP_005644111.1 hypothetical protein COCSUDRAFT_58315 [Coccomyxa subellipsoidea C-169]